MPTRAENAAIARELRLVLQQGGLLEQRIRAAATRQTITIEQYIRDRLGAGMSIENIREELINDLERDLPRYFGDFNVDLKDAIYTASNNARILGTKAAIAEGGAEKMWRWQTTGLKTVCDDCKTRHGEEDTYAGWIARGLPTIWGSLCDGNCQCTLVETDLVLEPITLAKEKPLQPTVSREETIYHAGQYEQARSAADDLMLDDDEIDALAEYTSEQWRPIDKRLREGKELTDEQENFVDIMDEIVEKLPKYDGDVYAGLKFSDEERQTGFLGQFVEGKVVTFRDFLSSSADAEIAKKFAGRFGNGVELVLMDAKGGVIGEFMTLFPEEQEIIVARNSSFVVERIKDIGGGAFRVWLRRI